MENPSWVSGEALWEWRRVACQQVSACAVNPQEAGAYLRELDWMLMAVAEVDRLALRLESYRNRPAINVERSLADLSTLWQRRLQEKVPLQYLLGRTTWRDFTLAVAPGVLIPRPETELLVDLAIAAAATMAVEPSHWADLGTGSGAIALALARSFPQAIVHAVDASASALTIAKQNAEQLGLADRVLFYRGSWLEPLESLQGKLTGIASNPPYIPSALVPALQPEVARHEPHLALDGGTDGLEFLRVIAERAPQFLQSGGVLLLEMMAGQAEAVADILKQSGCYCNIQIHCDLAGIQRFAEAYRI
ncbi:peptide chain release factor N(5)-glutamine methyltransferase [Altericista sp. CCNU0014]|uniref:peptide chain release factor N(5)-glutamine methyltransferase n=1 Tax=Altericista sp. CCNU0014 TaxID=3082949 RepID=UPI003850462F